MAVMAWRLAYIVLLLGVCTSVSIKITTTSIIGDAFGKLEDIDHIDSNLGIGGEEFAPSAEGATDEGGAPDLAEDMPDFLGENDGSGDGDEPDQVNEAKLRDLERDSGSMLDNMVPDLRYLIPDTSQFTSSLHDLPSVKDTLNFLKGDERMADTATASNERVSPGRSLEEAGESGVMQMLKNGYTYVKGRMMSAVGAAPAEAAPPKETDQKPSKESKKTEKKNKEKRASTEDDEEENENKNADHAKSPPSKAATAKKAQAPNPKAAPKQFKPPSSLKVKDMLKLEEESQADSKTKDGALGSHPAASGSNDAAATTTTTSTSSKSSASTGSESKAPASKPSHEQASKSSTASTVHSSEKPVQDHAELARIDWDHMDSLSLSKYQDELTSLPDSPTVIEARQKANNAQLKQLKAARAYQRALEERTAPPSNPHHASQASKPVKPAQAAHSASYAAAKAEASSTSSTTAAHVPQAALAKASALEQHPRAHVIPPKLSNAKYIAPGSVQDHAFESMGATKAGHTAQSILTKQGHAQAGSKPTQSQAASKVQIKSKQPVKTYSAGAQALTQVNREQTRPAEVAKDENSELMRLKMLADRGIRVMPNGAATASATASTNARKSAAKDEKSELMKMLNGTATATATASTNARKAANTKKPAAAAALTPKAEPASKASAQHKPYAETKAKPLHVLRRPTPEYAPKASSSKKASSTKEHQSAPSTTTTRKSGAEAGSGSGWREQAQERARQHVHASSEPSSSTTTTSKASTKASSSKAAGASKTDKKSTAEKKATVTSSKADRKDTARSKAEKEHEAYKKSLL